MTAEPSFPPIRIANGAGFLGDQLSAPQQLADSGEIDVLTLEYLAELTLSILAHAKAKDPAAGYAKDFVRVLPTLLPALQSQPNLRIVTNAGGLNPQACAVAVGNVLRKAGMADTIIGVVDGDDLLSDWETRRTRGEAFLHLDTGQPLPNDARPICANAYLGARPIVEALQQNARIVITGRVADASLTVAPCVHHFGWDWTDWNQLAGATVAGHIIECGAQATGGYSTSWKNHRLHNVGYPIAAVSTDGSCEITKPAGTDGAVNRQTVVEQLVYEIGDPAAYFTPDVVADFTSVQVVDRRNNMVSLCGVQGLPAPNSYKVSLAMQAGYTASAMLLVYGDDVRAKAETCSEIVWERVRSAGFTLEHTHWELLGTGDAAGTPSRQSNNEQPLHEAVLRLAVRAFDRRAVERFTAEIAPLITSGPAGLAGYAQPRALVRPAFEYWPTTIAKDRVTPHARVQPAGDWV